MIARKDRNDTATLITAFLSGRLDNSHTQLWHRVYQSEDDTVRYACEILGDYHEGYDCDVHLMDKSEWDHLERVRLVLLSDAELCRDSRCKFGARQLLCCVGLIAFAVFVFFTGSGWHLLAGTSILGVLVVAVGKFTPSTTSESNPYEPIIEPFATVQQLSNTYKSTASFRKNRFPKEWRDDTSDWEHLSWLINSFWLSVCAIVLLVLSPIILLVLAVPECEPKYTVVAG